MENNFSMCQPFKEKDFLTSSVGNLHAEPVKTVEFFLGILVEKHQQEREVDSIVLKNSRIPVKYRQTQLGVSLHLKVRL